MISRTIVCLFALALPFIARGQIGAGDTAPPITLEAISNAPDGVESLSWDDFGDKLVVLEFWGTWCGPCVAAIPHLNELAEHAGDRVAFLAVTFEGKAKIDAFREKQPMRAIIGHDTDKSMPSAFGVRGWPTTFLIRGGKVLFRGSPSKVSAEMLAALSAENLDLEALKKEKRFPGLSTGDDRSRNTETTGVPSLWKSAANADIQIMLGKPDPELGINSMSSFGNIKTEFMFTSTTIDQIIRSAWSVRSYQVSLNAAINREEQYMILFKANNAQLERARRSLAAALDIRILRGERTLSGYRVVIPPEGHRLPEPLGEGHALKIRSKYPDLTLSGPRVSFTSFVDMIQDKIGRPIEVPEELEGVDFKCEEMVLRVDDPDGVVKTIEKATGLRFKPAKIKVDMLFIDPIGSG